MELSKKNQVHLKDLVFLSEFQKGIAQLPASLQRGKTSPNKCPRYDTKQSDGEVPAMLELWVMRSTPLLPSLRGPL